MTAIFRTWREFEAASLEEQAAATREWIAEMERNHRRQCQLDDEADQRAFDLDLTDGESPINAAGKYARSGTNRTAEK